MKRKEYGLRYRLPDTITDVVPEQKHITEPAVMHCHDFYEIEVFMEGTGTEILNGHRYPLQRGCVTLMSPSDFHEVVPNGKLFFYNYMFRVTMLSPEMLHALWEFDGNKCIYFPEESFREIVNICQLLEWQNEKRAEDRALLMKNLMECFFVLLLRKLQQKPHAKNNQAANTIQKSIEYLHRHFRENPNLSQAAAVVNLHPNYFSQRFREVTGQTYTTYLTNLKITYAKKLLLSSKLSVTEICFASGFTSMSNFMKMFKKYTGLSPLQYIEQHNTARTFAEHP